VNGIEAYLGGSPLAAVGAAFAGGMLVSMTPCVYPMIPIVSAYVGAKSAGEKTRTRSFLLALGYVVGMGAVYSLLGMVAALSGGFFGKIATSPWALLIVANILILVALNILEVIPFPGWLPGRAVRPAAGGVIGAFMVGAASGLVASPCTSPVLFGLLTHVATSQRVVYGGVLVFAFSMGMGILLIVFGTFAGIAASLPKPGRWMNGVRTLLGLLMLGFAEYYLVRAGKAWF
jgi:thiol:disulfide interchange protein DsbD